MVIRDRIFNTITTVFKRHGAVTIDTYNPHFLHRLQRSTDAYASVLSSNSAKYSPANMVKTANSSTTSRTRAAKFAPYAMILPFLLRAGSP